MGEGQGFGRSNSTTAPQQRTTSMTTRSPYGAGPGASQDQHSIQCYPAVLAGRVRCVYAAAPAQPADRFPRSPYVHLPDDLPDALHCGLPDVLHCGVAGRVSWLRKVGYDQSAAAKASIDADTIAVRCRTRSLAGSSISAMDSRRPSGYTPGTLPRNSGVYIYPVATAP